MFLTKMDKLIWMILLLPLIDAQIRYRFTDKVTTYNVVEGRSAALACTSDTDVSIMEISRTGYTVENHILNKSVLNEQFADRFKYMFDNETSEHVLTIKKTSRAHNGYAYICSDNYYRRFLIFYVFYTPHNRAVCTTKYHTEKTALLQCEVELSKPKVFVEIHNYTYWFRTTQQINTTHLVKRAIVDNTVDMENIACSPVQFFPYQAYVPFYPYNKTYACAFENLSNNTTTPSTVGTELMYTGDKAMHNDGSIRAVTVNTTPVSIGVVIVVVVVISPLVD